MAEKFELTIKGNIEALRLEPGDVILVNVDRRITSEQAKLITEQVEDAIPGHRVLVVTKELALSATRP